MSRNARILTRSVFILAFLVLAAAPVAVAQNVLTGDWKASTDNNPDKISLSFERRTERGGHNQMGMTYDFADLQGLSREQAVGGGAVRFSLVREAGRIDCEGSFQQGKGSGTFRFTGSQSFVSAMKSRGFDFEKLSSVPRRQHEPEERLFA